MSAPRVALGRPKREQRHVRGTHSDCSVLMLPSDAGIEPTSRPPRKPLQAGNGARHISSKGARSGASWPRASLAARGATHSPTSAPFASQEVPSREHSAVGVPAAAAPQPNAAAAQGCGPRDAAVHRSPSAPQVAASSPGPQAKAAEVARSDAVTMESRAQRAAWSRMPRARPAPRGHSRPGEAAPARWRAGRGCGARLPVLVVRTESDDECTTVTWHLCALRPPRVPPAPPPRAVRCAAQPRLRITVTPRAPPLPP